MVRRAGLWVILAAFAAGSILSASVTGTPLAFRHLYALHHDGRVTIQNPYGDVTITSWDRDAVLVEAVKHSWGMGSQDDARVIVESTGDSLAIHTQYAGSDAEHPTSVEYRITVPRGAHLENVALTNGRLTVDGIAGSVKATSVNGDIRALKLSGPVELSTINGRVDAAFESTNRQHPISLSSVNGPIRLTIPSRSNANVEAHNLSGGISSEIGPAIRSSAGHRLIVRGNGPQIRLHNVNGGIWIAADRSNT